MGLVFDPTGRESRGEMNLLQLTLPRAVPHS